MNQCDTPCFFGTDGVRGILGQYPMHPEAILKLGWALGQFLSRRFKTGCVLIGKDTRVSGYVLESALESGIASSGFDVLLVGPMPTPAIAYLTQTFRAQAGIVVSASHNLYRDNGIKLFHANGNKLSQADEQAISELMQAPMVIDGNRLGKAERIEDALGRYVEFCKRAVPVDTKLTDFKIVLDVAHGAAYQAAPLVFEELGAQVVTLHNRPNGYNINAGCGSTDPQTLRAHVLKEGADCGLAFDGDGDRLIMVDHLGAVVDGDGILYVLSRYMKRHNLLRQGIVGTMMTNEALVRQFAQEGFLLNGLQWEIVR